MQADRDKLIDMGFQVVDYDIKNKTLFAFQSDLSKFDGIFMAGGNTFYLLQVFRDTGFDFFIKDFISSGKIYLGASAGSCIMSPTISHLASLDHAEQFPDLTDYTALGLVNELIVPHGGRDKYKERHAKIKADWGDKTLFLRDDQALVVNSDKIEVVTKQ
jgi:dipeptidase E